MGDRLLAVTSNRATADLPNAVISRSAPLSLVPTINSEFVYNETVVKHILEPIVFNSAASMWRLLVGCPPTKTKNQN